MEILLKSQQITKEQLERALSLQKEKGIPLRRVLVDEGILTEEVLLSLFSEQLYIRFLFAFSFKYTNIDYIFKSQITDEPTVSLFLSISNSGSLWRL